MARIDIRDAKIADYATRRDFALGYLQTKAGAQGEAWSYYSGSDLLKNCVLTTAPPGDRCLNSFELEVVGLDHTLGPVCVEAHGLRTLKDMQSLIKRFARESPQEAREAGELLGIVAFMKYADPRRCPETAEATAARAARKELTSRAIEGDAEEQYQLGLRTSGSESAYWHCLAAKQGHAAAQYEYGNYLETYRSDLVSAYRWYQLSARQNYWQAPGALGRIEESLSAGELAEARRQVDDWQKDPCPSRQDT